MLKLYMLNDNNVYLYLTSKTPDLKTYPFFKEAKEYDTRDYLDSISHTVIDLDESIPEDTLEILQANYILPRKNFWLTRYRVQTPYSLT